MQSHCQKVRLGFRFSLPLQGDSANPSLALHQEATHLTFVLGWRCFLRGLAVSSPLFSFWLEKKPFYFLVNRSAFHASEPPHLPIRVQDLLAEFSCARRHELCTSAGCPVASPRAGGACPRARGGTRTTAAATSALLLVAPLATMTRLITVRITRLARRPSWPRPSQCRGPPQGGQESPPDFGSACPRGRPCSAPRPSRNRGAVRVSTFEARAVGIRS